MPAVIINETARSWGDHCSKRLTKKRNGTVNILTKITYTFEEENNHEDTDGYINTYLQRQDRSLPLKTDT